MNICMDSPPSSPDLNPAENDWALLEALLQRRQQGPSKRFRAVTGARRDNVGWGNMEYYLYNLNNCTSRE
jgi:transposase